MPKVCRLSYRQAFACRKKVIMTHTDIYSYVLQLLPFLCAGAAFIYGIIHYFKKGKALFIQLVICAMGCMMLRRLFSLVCLLTGTSVSEGFNVGYLGELGCYQFLFSASYGQMDELVDCREKSLRKYRLMSLISPVIVAVCYAFILASPLSIENRIIDGVLTAMMMLSVYYQTKQLIVPDVEFGILKSIRPYNALAIGMTLITELGMIFAAYDLAYLLMTVTVMLSAIYLVLIPVLGKGVEKWTI